MITFRTSAEVTADHQVVLSVPPSTPVGRAEFVVTIAPQPAEKMRGLLRKNFGAVRSGNSHSADNDRIDADLSDAYHDSHE